MQVNKEVGEVSTCMSVEGSTSSRTGETCRYTHAANADAVKIRGMIGGGGFEAKIQAFACITSMLT